MFYFASLATTFSFFWFGWLLGFVVIELIALHDEKNQPPKNYDGGTLSELIWRLTRRNKLFAIVFTLLWIVLTYHFFIYHP